MSFSTALDHPPRKKSRIGRIGLSTGQVLDRRSPLAPPHPTILEKKAIPSHLPYLTTEPPTTTSPQKTPSTIANHQSVPPPQPPPTPHTSRDQLHPDISTKQSDGTSTSATLIAAEPKKLEPQRPAFNYSPTLWFLRVIPNLKPPLQLPYGRTKPNPINAIYCRVNDVSIPLVERLRPVTRRHIIGNHDSVEQINGWLSRRIAKRASKDDKHVLLLTGPPGVGKTSTVNALLYDLNIIPVEANASQPAPAYIEGGLGMQMMKFIDSVRYGGCKAIILEEIDGVSPTKYVAGIDDDRDAAIEHLSPAERMAIIVADWKSSDPILILTCNDRYAPGIKLLEKHCQIVQFQRLSDDCVAQLIDNQKDLLLAMFPNSSATLARYVSPMTEERRSLIEIVAGDARTLWNTLELTLLGGDESENPLLSDEKDRDERPLSLVWKLLNHAHMTRTKHNRKKDNFLKLVHQYNTLRHVCSNFATSELLARCQQYESSIGMGQNAAQILSRKAEALEIMVEHFTHFADADEISTALWRADDSCGIADTCASSVECLSLAKSGARLPAMKIRSTKSPAKEETGSRTFGSRIWSPHAARTLM